MGWYGGVGWEAEGIVALKGLWGLLLGETRALWVLGSGVLWGSSGSKDTGSLSTGLLCRTEGLKLGGNPKLQVSLTSQVSGGLQAY